MAGQPRGGYASCRQFLNTLGVGATGACLYPGEAAAAAGSEAAATTEAAHAPGCAPPPSGYFGRMFCAPPFAEASPALHDALPELGAPDGPLDARDPLERGPVALITDPAARVNNPDNPAHSAGTTFFGQFIDHDMTFDGSSQLGVATAPERVRNARMVDDVLEHGPRSSRPATVPTSLSSSPAPRTASDTR